MLQTARLEAWDTSKVTRFEVIDHRENGTGRVIVEYVANVELIPQDDGRTLKVRITDKQGS